jgi:hypothetical protein
MATHPSGETVKILGIASPTNGRSCEEHEICGSVLDCDVVVRLRKVQVVVSGKEESAIGVFWVSDGIDRCMVGFLPRHHIKHWKKYEGVLAQITEIYCKDDNNSPTKQQKSLKNHGCAIAAIISSPPLHSAIISSPPLHSPSRKQINLGTNAE